MSDLDGLGLRFSEAMSGHLALGETDPLRGEAAGKAAGSAIRFDVRIEIEGLGRFLRVPEHAASLAGTVSLGPLGEGLPIEGGTFHLFTADPAGGRTMRYAFRFASSDGRRWYLQGRKDVRDDPGALDVVGDMTTLFTTLHQGDGPEAPVAGAGVLRFALGDAPALLASMEVTGASGPWQKVEALTAFASFAWGALRDEYLRSPRLFYDTRLENLVLSGALRRATGGEVPFFLVSGVHDRGFPWGDGELFWDLLLLVGDGQGGWRRFANSDRVLPGLRLDVAGGLHRYQGPAFALAGPSAAFSELRRGAPGLSPCGLTVALDFEARAHEAVGVHFPLVPRLVRRLSAALAKELRDHLPGTDPLGIFITPHTVTPRSGTIRIDRPGHPAEEYALVADRSFGEAERTTFRNLKEPTTLYGYLCALRPASRAARVQIHARALRDEKERWARDRLDAYLGSVVSRVACSELRLEGGTLTVHPMAPAGAPALQAPPIRRLGEPLLEIRNDHFPTAVFLRRIREVKDPGGERCLALEEDMDLLRLEARNSDRSAPVAAFHDPDAHRALDRVLLETGFDELLRERHRASGKDRAAFSVVVKPNFMFAYDRRDRSTYTDPALVAHLAARIRALGFPRVRIVEAQSTYGEYFDRRSVREMADYLGYGVAGCEVVDMTLDADEVRDLGPALGRHPVSAAWRDADFRISFAKNKTHAYAFYTLTLKNVYGALPLADKFKEYHCKRGIYATTIEYLRAFPVHFGLVDAALSADGPFGIFADPRPNPTETVLGGPDLVAVDWVGATKMGIDPMISPYMRLAVEAFGKPAIRFTGDPTPYRPWLNVPVALTLFTNEGVDASHYFGNLMYSALAQMDETHFTHRNRSLFMRLLRAATNPLRRTFFLRTGEDPSAANRLVSWLFYRMGF
ncbi:MAG: DUF362 domain-containing protein [Deltaproteobacteria bacterium]|nr:DUF362 domain-containing protein [Deltaproteobacteria bacterium]